MATEKGLAVGQENTFHYSYSATQHDEVRKIREKYLPREETPMEQLRRLDRALQVSGMAESLTVGIIGCLIFGLGLCFALGVIGGGMVLGIIIGLIGAAVMITAYPAYRFVSNKTKAKLTPRILELADQLSV